VAQAISVRPAERDDVGWLARNDGHLDAGRLAAKVDAGEVLLAEVDAEPAGLLRFDLLWSAVPFVALVRVRDPLRRRGVGRALVASLADRARADGATFLLSSATEDEPAARAWHAAIGFTVCGELSGINAGGVGEVVYRLGL
jgi:GNAT superfamily N-acetyltransferase